ncbi:MAG TPA: ATP-binding protein [Verrucomicrobiae bacterium]|nr:ATP-binding protein [Verrucomicrobiae bacterium]
MTLFKSIKWRLQLWYGLILVIVLAGFGITSYQLERNRQFRQIDDELHRRIGILASALHRPPPRGQRDQRGGGPPGDDQPFDRPPRGQFSDDGPPDQDQQPRPDQRPDQRPGQGFPPITEFHLPERDAHLFDPSDPHGFYFLIESMRGKEMKEIARSTNNPDTLGYMKETAINNIAPKFPDSSKPPRTFNLETYRVAYNTLPSGESIWVGCSVVPELDDLHRTAFTLTGVGLLILFVGLAGGWWFVSRALRPIEEISATAVKISSGDLAQRINVAEAESELGQLAAVLNSTFARLETAFAQQKQFASDAAHELRTPVSVILTQTQMALGRDRDAAGYKQIVEACQRAAQRMRKLIESLLELARFDAGQEVLKRLPFDLANTVNDGVELVQTLAEERRVKIITELSPLPITGDSGRIAQVVTNLLTNAIQYNNPDGEVRVTLESAGNLAVLTVADTGKGIASEDLPRVFERFYRADKSRTGAGNSGLGLSICKAIVEAHGGAIEAASVSGTGTTFTVRLPINA